MITQSGMDIGRLQSVLFDTERGMIKQLCVRPAGLVRGFVEQELLIGWDEVVAWNQDQVTVRDAFVPVPSAVTVVAQNPA